MLTRCSDEFMHERISKVLENCFGKRQMEDNKHADSDDVTVYLCITSEHAMWSGSCRRSWCSVQPAGEWLWIFVNLCTYYRHWVLVLHVVSGCFSSVTLWCRCRWIPWVQDLRKSKELKKSIVAMDDSSMRPTQSNTHSTIHAFAKTQPSIHRPLPPVTFDLSQQRHSWGSSPLSWWQRKHFIFIREVNLEDSAKKSQDHFLLLAFVLNKNN